MIFTINPLKSLSVITLNRNIQFDQIGLVLSKGEKIFEKNSQHGDK